MMDDVQKLKERGYTSEEVASKLTMSLFEVNKLYMVNPVKRTYAPAPKSHPWRHDNFGSAKYKNPEGFKV